jgi:alkylation response protein AidB-like acyl-CoA dehydrogenase
MNAERILVAQEFIGDGRWLLQKGIDYAKERVVFDRPIGDRREPRRAVVRCRPPAARGARG